MKTFLLPLLLGLSVSVMAQQSRTNRIHTSIDDDDKTLSIQVEGTTNGKEISYNRRFDVAGMSSTDKSALKQRVFDSLGLGEPPYVLVHPPTPVPPKPTRMYDAPPVPRSYSDGVDEESVTFDCKTCTGRMRLEISGDNYSLTRETDGREDREKAFPMTVSMAPGDYRYTYWQNGIQQMQLAFRVKPGEKNVVTVK